ncbi:MAG TPA: DUF2232 domain-containing protein, partial [Nitrospirota bacterium]
MNENPTRTNWRGPLAPGLLALFILSSFLFFPFAGAFMLFLLPAPIAYSRAMYGNGQGTLISAACVGLATAAGGFPVVSFAVMALCICGFSMGGSIATGEKYDRAILKGTLLPFFFTVPVIAGYFLLGSINPWAVLDTELARGMQESITLYKQMGMSKEDIDAIMPSLKLVSNLMRDYLPAVCLTTMAMLAATSYVAAARHYFRASGTVPEFKMNEWIAPDLAVWGIIIPG